MKKVFFSFILLVVLLLITSNEALAQCPMCKMAAESNLKDGGTAGRGLNNGILYMLTLPYLLVGGVAFVWWRNRRDSQDDSAQIANIDAFSDN